MLCVNPRVDEEILGAAELRDLESQVLIGYLNYTKNTCGHDFWS